MREGPWLSALSLTSVMNFFFLYLFLLVAVRLSVEQSLSYQITTDVNATNLPQWRLIENELDSML